MNNLVVDLNSSSSVVVLSAIEALETSNPQLLKENIVPLLLHSDLIIRSRAVRAMCRFDRTEAIRYLEAMLFSKVNTERDMALVHAFFFPFKQIEALLLKFVTVEQEPALIQKAGIVFMTNPDWEMAYRLFESKESTNSLRSDLINSILMGVLNSLYQAKLVAEPPVTLLNKLKVAFRNKKLKIYINHFTNLLASEDPETRFKAAIKLCELNRQNVADVSSIINKFLKEEANEAVKAKVGTYWKNCYSLIAQSKGTDISNPEERQKLYASINETNYKDLISLLLPELRTYEASEQITILELIKSYGTKAESSYVVGFLNSIDPYIQQACIDCLCQIDSETLQPELPRLLKSNNDDVKQSAINAFALTDKAAALAMVTQMLNSPRVAQRKSALFCLGSFDFASVSDILVAALKREKDNSLIEEIHTILFENANEELFCWLFIEAKKANGDSQTLINHLLTRMANRMACQGVGRKSEDFYALAEARWKEEKDNQAQRESYRLEKIENLRKVVIEKSEEEERLALTKFALVSHGIGFAFSLLIWFAFLAPNSWFGQEKKEATKTVVASQNVESKAVELPTEPISVKGRVIDSNKEYCQVMLEDESGKMYMLSFSEESKVPTTGNEYSAQVFVEDFADGVYTAEVITAY